MSAVLQTVPVSIVRISKKPNSKYFYMLDRYDSQPVRLVGVLGLVSLSFSLVGFINFLRISPEVCALFAPIVVIVTLYQLANNILMAQYPGFDIRKHYRLITAYRQRTPNLPKVAVFIPAAGEDVQIVRATVKAAMKIVYAPYAVFILDDSQEALYRDIAASLGCEYLRRDDVGNNKKAGNMNYALQCLDGFQQVLVLDADFKPRPEILNELLPYSGEDIGIVQSPQHFPLTDNVHRRSKIEYGAAYIQQDFYRITQVARDKFNAAICVGTNALYNVEAIRQVGGWEGVGTPKGWAHSEDVYTGLKILHTTNAEGERYKIKYIPVQLAEGFCPDNHYSFYKQQNRWCTGSIQLLFSCKTLFSRKLSLSQRLIYGSNSLYYYYTIALLISPLYLLVITLLNTTIEWKYTFFFLPSLLTNLCIGPILLRKQYRPIATTLVILSNAYTFLQALYLLIRHNPLGWEASGVKQNGRSLHFTKFKLTAYLTVMLLYVPTFGAIFLNNKLTFGPSILLVAAFLVSFATQLGFLYYILIGGIIDRKRLYTDRKFFAAIFMTATIVVVGVLGFRYHKSYHVTFGKHDVIKLVKQTDPSRATITSQPKH